MKIDFRTYEGILTFMWMSYWYAALYVVIEGWDDLSLRDPEVDRLLASPDVDLLRRYRNGVFHYRRRYFDDRFLQLIDEGEAVVTWVHALNQALGWALLERLDGFGQERQNG